MRKFLYILFLVFVVSSPIQANKYGFSDEIMNMRNPKGLAAVTDERPNNKGAKAKMDDDLEQLKTQQFITVRNDDAIDKFTIEDYERFFVPLEEAIPSLTFIPSTISQNVFEDKNEQGAVLKSVITIGDAKGKWGGVERFFSLKNNVVLSIEEIDYLSSGQEILLQKDFINESVNGNPAIFIIKKTRRGNAMSELSWFTDSRFFTIKMSGVVSGTGRLNKLVELAESIRSY